MPFGYPSSAASGSPTVFYVVFVAEEVRVGDKGSGDTRTDVSSSVFSVVLIAEEVDGVEDKGSGAQRLMYRHSWRPF